jgi:hypothetical protein
MGRIPNTRFARRRFGVPPMESNPNRARNEDKDRTLPGKQRIKARRLAKREDA